MQGGGHADVLMYFKCPPTQQMQYPVNGYAFFYETPFLCSKAASISQSN